jgi:hypothetical protein
LSNLRDTFQELRDIGFSGSDQFMNRGHRIINSNRAFAGPKRRKAKWAMNDDAVQALLLQTFPKLETSESQRRRAGRWARIIQLYYRLGLSYGHTAAEMKVTTRYVRTLLRNIRRAAAKRPCAGAPVYGRRGRPKKDSSLQ